jgi:hypothetical protein
MGLLIGVYGIFIPAIGWKWGIIVTVYALCWFLINDCVKVFFYRSFIRKNRIFKKKFWKTQYDYIAWNLSI